MGEVMLNGERKVWYYKESLTSKGAVKNWHMVRICPSTRHFSVITNNGFPAATMLSLIPTAILIAGGVLLTVFFSWVVGVLLFLISIVPPLAVVVRYMNSYAWRGDAVIRDVQDAFSKMSKVKQKEYNKYLEGAFARTVDLDKVLKLFKACAKESGIDKDLEDEIKIQEAVQTAVSGALNEGP
jgi:ABC-type multidrug transport system fused ATPase/permease subunit